LFRTGLNKISFNCRLPAPQCGLKKRIGVPKMSGIVFNNSETRCLDLLEKAPCNWHVLAANALDRGLIAGVVASSVVPP
jgi:hypothetical protein